MPWWQTVMYKLLTNKGRLWFQEAQEEIKKEF